MGETGNILHRLANEYGVLKDKFEDFHEIFVKTNGETIPPEKMRPYLKEFQEVLTKSHDSNEILSDIFKKHLENSETEDKEIIMRYFKNLVESLTPVTNWDQETGAGINSFETIPGSTAISMKTGCNALLYMLMV